MKEKFIGVVAEVCVCPECRFIYITNMKIDCENNECKRFGKLGVMCNVISPLTQPKQEQ